MFWVPDQIREARQQLRLDEQEHQPASTHQGLLGTAAAAATTAAGDVPKEVLGAGINTAARGLVGLGRLQFLLCAPSDNNRHGGSYAKGLSLRLVTCCCFC